MAMQSPEILLPQLNNALRKLRAACADMGNEEIDDKLLEVMRRLLLAEVFGNTWILAMGGSQGAGKTTLMASLYGLRGNGPNWLQGNEGRGEKMPVLIVENDEIKTAQGYVSRLVPDEVRSGFRVADVKVDIAEFQRAICDPNPEDLLPVLKVPRRYFTRENQAWLLLPGYEKEERANRSWQQLMRQAMMAAGGCIVVTDETRMANQQQLEIVQDMLQNELGGHEPCIVITKTEAHRNDPQRLAQLRASAEATFDIKPENAGTHIICSGTDDADYMDEWLPQLRSAIDNLNRAGHADRPAQLSSISEILGKDLTRVLNTIRSKATLFFSDRKTGGAEGAAALEEVLEAFDEAASELREAHNSQVQDLLGKAYSKAAKELSARLSSDHEGFRNWISKVFDTTSESTGKMQHLVQTAWKQAVPTLFSDYASSLKALTLPKLGWTPEQQGGGESVVLENGAAHERAMPEKLVQLGYKHASGRMVQFSQLNANTSRDIRILLGHASEQDEQAHAEASKGFEDSVKLVPAVALEYARLFYALPEDAGLNPVGGSTDNPYGMRSNFAEDSVESLQAGVKLGQTAIRSLAGVLAIDVVSDGDSDILGTIFGGAPAGALTLHPAAVAATAVVAAGYVTVRAITGLRSFEKDASVQAYNLLGAVHDHHVAHLRQQFDKSMSETRARIKAKIRARYRMDEVLMKKDRLAKAIADVVSINGDLRHELDSSAAGLQLFNVAARAA